MDNNFQLSELQRDAIIEFLSIGMGNAANSLSQMVNEEVKLSIPALELLTPQQVTNYFSTKSHAKAVKQHFHGPFWGDVLLLFDPENSFQFVQVWLKNKVPQALLTEIEPEALIEISNIIIGACLSSLADILTQELIPEIPIFMTGTTAEILDMNTIQQEEIVMFLQVDFSLSTQEIKGYVAFILEIPSVERFKASIDKYLSVITL